MNTARPRDCGFRAARGRVWSVLPWQSGPASIWALVSSQPTHLRRAGAQNPAPFPSVRGYARCLPARCLGKLARHLTRSTLTAAMVAGLFSVAQAQMAEGETVIIGGTVLCDTRDQIIDVTEAHARSFNRGVMVTRFYALQFNTSGDPVCVWIGLPAEVTIDKIGDRSFRVHSPQGKTVAVRIVAVTYTAPDDTTAHGWVFLAERFLRLPVRL